MNWLGAVQCPHCGGRGITVSPIPVSVATLPERGQAVCLHCDTHFPIRAQILDLTQPRDLTGLTLAGASNHVPPVPQLYEAVWRPRSLSLLTGEPFSPARELALLNAWLGIQPNELVLDLGSSTDFYARGVAAHARGAMIAAIDLAEGMLRVGIDYARRDGATNIVHVRAPVQRLPFADASVDALMCGGSLNEFRSMREALAEARRVVTPTGRLFTMSLLAATSLGGKLGQCGARTSGITFPRLEQFNETIQAAGWRCERQQVFGAVVFTLMQPVEA